MYLELQITKPLKLNSCYETENATDQWVRIQTKLRNILQTRLRIVYLHCFLIFQPLMSMLVSCNTASSSTQSSAY